jgi:23S rRNA (guanine745-N1)-methyltransferase
MLLCTVRTCHQPLAREERRVFCPRGHSFDIARSGYINLLQPQERRSKQPGDSADAVEARRRLHDRGVTKPLLDAIAHLANLSGASSLTPTPDTRPSTPALSDIVLDAGCGDGFYLGSLRQRSGCQSHGIDISIPAIDAAARRYPECEWIVGNADRFVPYAEATFTRVLSITARMNSPEFRRVIRDDGRLIVAIPSPEDLVELRGIGRERATRTIETFANEFSLLDQRRVSTTANLDRDAVHDVLLSIYRPRSVDKVAAMQVTFSLDLLLFAPR